MMMSVCCQLTTMTLITSALLFLWIGWREAVQDLRLHCYKVHCKYHCAIPNHIPKLYLDPFQGHFRAHSQSTGYNLLTIPSHFYELVLRMQVSIQCTYYQYI